jgi:hypothetical protein
LNGTHTEDSCRAALLVPPLYRPCRKGCAARAPKLRRVNPDAAETTTCPDGGGLAHRSKCDVTWVLHKYSACLVLRMRRTGRATLNRLSTTTSSTPAPRLKLMSDDYVVRENFDDAPVDSPPPTDDAREVRRPGAHAVLVIFLTETAPPEDHLRGVVFHVPANRHVARATTWVYAAEPFPRTSRAAR